MKTIVVLGVLVCSCLAQQHSQEAIAPQRKPRTPQGHLQYNGPDGLRVSWKHYTPYTHRRYQLDSPQRSERSETSTAQPRAFEPQAQLIQPEASAAPAPEYKSAQPFQVQQIQYQPYSMVPAHIKQLLLQMYEPQAPYVDPAVFLYNVQQEQQQQQQQNQQEEQRQQSEQESAQEARQFSRYEAYKYPHKYPHNKSKPGYVHQQPEEQPQQQQPQEQERQEGQQEEAGQENGGMPREIHELLQLQAQIPYHVIADRIIYKPKSMFVPKPISAEDTAEDTAASHAYRTKIYYLKNDEDQQESSEQSQPRGEKAEQ